MAEEFHIYPCKLCGKVPLVIKNNNVEDETRYKLSHCDIEVNGHTETQCIVNWNKLSTKKGERR